MNGLTVTRVDFMIDGTIVGTADDVSLHGQLEQHHRDKGSHSLTGKVTTASTARRPRRPS